MRKDGLIGLNDEDQLGEVDSYVEVSQKASTKLDEKIVCNLIIAYVEYNRVFYHYCHEKYHSNLLHLRHFSLFSTNELKGRHYNCIS